MILQRRSGVSRAADRLQDTYPDVVFHLRDYLVGLDPSPRRTPTEDAYARVPDLACRGRLVVTAGARRRDGVVTEWAVQIAAFRSGTQVPTPRVDAWAWAYAVFGEVLRPSVRRVADGLHWPWPDRLRIPAEKFLVLDPHGSCGRAPTQPRSRFDV